MTPAPLRARLYRRLVLLAAGAVLPALAVMAYHDAADRRLTRERTLANTIRLTRVAADQQAAVFKSADALLQTLAVFPALQGNDDAGCQVLARVLRNESAYLDIAVVAPDGAVPCSARPGTTRVNVADRPWFQRVRKTGRATVSEYQLGRPSGRADLIVARPLPGGTGRVLAIAVDLTELQHLASEVRFPSGALVALIDANRRIVARYPDEAQLIGRQIPASSLPGSAATENVAQATGIDGREYIFVTVQLDTGLEPPLYMTLGVEPSVIYADVTHFERQQAIVLALVGLLALAVAAIGGRAFVVRPMETVTEVTGRIAAGDFSARAQLANSPFGLSEIGGAINAMAGALAAREDERRAFADRLQASEQRYRLLFARNPCPMWVFDQDSLRFLEVNDAAVAQYGYSRDEFLAMVLPDIRDFSTAEELTELVARLEKGTSIATRSRHRTKAGVVLEVEIISHPLFWNGSRARLVMATDVTARLQTEQQLRLAEERLQFALEASGVGAWEANLKTGDAYWSATCEALHGCAPGTFGRNFSAFLATIHPDDAERVRATVIAALKEHRQVEFEFRTVWPDGTTRQLRAIGRYFYDQDGTAVRGAGIEVDITDQRTLEDQYRQAQKMEAIGQLAGGVAHDFNNMLTAILGNAEYVLEEMPRDDPRWTDVDAIRRSANRAAELTHQLLAFSRKQILVPRVLHLGDVVTEVAPMLRRLLGETIDLRTVVSNRRHVKADALQLQQVLLNLGVNARDAMPNGGRLTIETSDIVLDAQYANQSRPVEPGPYVMLAVTDTGHGMDAGTQQRIFEPFFTTKPQGRGTGLGLATVYGIVKQSGGYIWVYSEIGRGTTFKVYLPQTDETAVNAADRPANRRTFGGTERILLLEDEDGVREWVAKVLAQYGYDVRAAGTPSEAIAVATGNGSLDLIVSDVVLPEMNGPGAVERIRQVHPSARVLYISGYADAAIVDHGVLAGGTPFLQKPFTIDALLHAVRSTLDGVALDVAVVPAAPPPKAEASRAD